MSEDKKDKERQLLLPGNSSDPRLLEHEMHLIEASELEKTYGIWKAWASHAAQRRVDDRDAHTHRHARTHIGEQSWRRTRVSDEWSEPAASDKDGRQAGPELRLV